MRGEQPAGPRPGRGVIIALDQGTSSTKVVALDDKGEVLDRHVVSVKHSTPRPGWVEQSPHELLGSILVAADAIVSRQPGPIVAIGLSNQRESAMVWDTRSGAPLSPLLGWQDRRTLERARLLSKDGGADRVRTLSGLPLDPMFSALKFGWLLDEVDPTRSLSRAGKVTVGTLDAWLVHTLTGQRRIEAGNASRTQLLDVRTGTWSEELLEIFGVPAAALPEVTPSDTPTGVISGAAPLVGGRIHGVLGDSHAALFAHGVREPGAVKATYGTGSSVMGLTADPVGAASGLVETIAWQREGQTSRAFEGNILSTGATLLWLADVLDCSVHELSLLAQSVPDAGGVSLVPAFSGLGAPWWDEDARSLITGFGPGHRRAHLARAAFDSIALQVEDVLAHADKVAGALVHTVFTDGGPSRNDWLMQLQADVSRRAVHRSEVAELSVTGAAHLAGVSAGVWTDADLASMPRPRSIFTDATLDGRTSLTANDALRDSWRGAVQRSRVAV